ncbi:sodium-driven chloride bicarbonate exchanger-like isoform X1 [Lethenteron reissneri]|uniref:sodium-driven chloride bicarbonate exchanger-like isoform X1 n=1 Tax=Lethenteron reissneri TaxID=7753 RepID=UPI002AB67639|nr:sodium-driven chloride bicarbonate exchanger-like isoform X1 [Lethenteron reissneri]
MDYERRDAQHRGTPVLEPLLSTRNDDEAVLDRGKTSAILLTNFEKEELEAHRTVYIGLHVPSGRRSHRRHRHRGGHRHHHRRRVRDKEANADDSESGCQDTPSQRVQFILGVEDDDEEHVAHDLFTEMDELCMRDGEECEWRETARWLKFEEDVEDGGERWSKPYVATLSLHSLFELRSCIMNGTVMLDMKATTLDEIADLVLDNQIASGQLDVAVRDRVRQALLKRHHHQSEKKLSHRIPIVRSLADMGKKYSDTHLLEKNGHWLGAHRASLTCSRANLLQKRASIPTSPPPTDGTAPTEYATERPRSLAAGKGGAAPSRGREAPAGDRRSSTAGADCGDGSGGDDESWDELRRSSTVVLPVVLEELPARAALHQGCCSCGGQCLANPYRACMEPSRLAAGANSFLTSPHSAPGNLADEDKVCEGRAGESSTVDFSKQPSATWHCGCISPDQGWPGIVVDLNFLRKIPQGAEASNVLVGEVDFLERPVIAFVRLSPAVLLSGLAEVPIPTRFLFILLGPSGKATQYHEIGRSIATLMSDEIFSDVAYKAKDRKDLLSGIDEFLDQVTVLPPGEWDPSIRIEPPKNVPSQEKRKLPSLVNGASSQALEPEHESHGAGPELQRTGRIFGGLVRDIKRKIPFYLSDYRDSLNLQCIASFLFLYCACMSPVITFGGLLGEATEGRISAIESLFGASMTGIAYSLFAGQPLTILGSTGPVLVFEKILYKFCKDYDLSYLSLRACIGLWTAFLCLLLVATDASSLVCYITRFTEEAFASLICIIFIYEALEKLVHLGETYEVNMHADPELLTQYSCVCVEPSVPSNETLAAWDSMNHTADSIPWGNLTVSKCLELHGEFVGTACGHHGPYIPDVLFWSIILFFATFFLSGFLKQFKTMRYFPTKVRSTVSDFAVFLTILSMVVIDYFLGIPSPKLQVPSEFKPTRDDRGWIVDPIGRNPWWTILAAAIPALLCTILVFMDQQITAVIINRKEHKLKKGCGYHLDLLWVAIMLAVCSIMGLPWFVAATVLSISHVNSLKVESECSAPGEQPKFLGIREQRVTGLMIFVLMGCSVFMTGVLKFIPMPVLYGVFLYMGASSLKGIQFFDRIKLFGMPAKHQPDFIYLRHVPLRKVHLFTAVQFTCLVLLWVIKASPAAIVFPMMVLALVFIRKLLDFCFTKRELSWLDDLMPESRKKKLEDALREQEDSELRNSGGSRSRETQRMLEVAEVGTVQVPLEGGNVLKIPVKGIKFSQRDPSIINISEEMSKTAVWKTLAGNTDNAHVDVESTGQNPGKKVNLVPGCVEHHAPSETSV